MKKTFAVFLSLIVILCSLHLNLNAHYCGQHLVDVALFGEATKCPMAMERCCKDKKNSCCSDRDIVIEGEDLLSSKDFTKIKLTKFEQLLAELNIPIITLNDNLVAVDYPINYSPPLIEREVSVLFQSFLL